LTSVGILPTDCAASVCIASDARFYWLARGNPENDAGCCGGGSACCAADGSTAGTLGRNAPGRGDAPFETLSTCLALIEIVNSCNLSCPTCYADSPLGIGQKVDAVPLDDLKRRIQGVDGLMVRYAQCCQPVPGDPVRITIEDTCPLWFSARLGYHSRRAASSPRILKVP
jgi:hypothetical protein